MNIKPLSLLALLSTLACTATDPSEDGDGGESSTTNTSSGISASDSTTSISTTAADSDTGLGGTMGATSDTGGIDTDGIDTDGIDTDGIDTDDGGGSDGQSERLANHDGACTQVLGCPTGPQDVVECFTSTLEPPFEVAGISYAFGTSEMIDLPTSASLAVLEWEGEGTSPGAVLDTVALEPETDIVADVRHFVLSEPVEINVSTFCVAVQSEDAFGIVKSTTASVPDSSFLRAEQCGAGTFVGTADAGFAGNWCMEAEVRVVAD